MLVAVAVGWDGRRGVLGVELANRESRSRWRDCLLGPNERGLPFAGSCPRPRRGSDRASADARWDRVRGRRRSCRDCRAALREVLSEAADQRCYLHFLRNALDYVPRLSAPRTSRRRIGPSPMVGDDCLQARTTASFDRWLHDRRDLAEARRDLAAWLTKWQARYPKLTGWVEENIEETLTFHRLPRQHHQH